MEDFRVKSILLINVGLLMRSLFIRSTLNWDDVRCQQILNELMRDGVAWVDEQTTEKTYWFPSFFKPLMRED